MVVFLSLNLRFLNILKMTKLILREAHLKKLHSKGQLTAFKHNGFWQCMDTLRDKEILEKKIKDKDYFEKK